MMSVRIIRILLLLRELRLRLESLLVVVFINAVVGVQSKIVVRITLGRELWLVMRIRLIHLALLFSLLLSLHVLIV
jgi:hypothetical protein